ncbi:phospholipase [Streptomyces actuosus]|uniref:phospholipase C n=1 Tax=Streptomyces actuosus TaxID=1885 RepID=A0ABS2VIX6_STRAS|nr:alkaline phosphatase family protein [Streptomyces actuosus]MBN0043042.1 phospholipase [Streptomyces actuosus]
MQHRPVTPEAGSARPDRAPEQVPGADVRPGLTRRGLITGASAAGAAALIGKGAEGRPNSDQSRLLDTALAAASSSAGLSDIEHVVVLMQENRSFDHYFGTLSQVRGFSDPDVRTQSRNGHDYPVFDQFGFQPGVGVTPSGYLQPFRLQSRPPLENGQSTNDVSHSWATQHRSWNGGAMDSFVDAHLDADGAANGPVTMGYFTRQDLPFYYALADAFTICDGYFCSVLGPTDPNRLMLMSASIDPEGEHGGPVVQTFGNRLAEYGKLSWETMPERLLEAGVSWKVYNDPLGVLAINPLPYFKNYTNPFSRTGIELVGRGLTPSYPATFKADVASGRLPSVSWIIPPLAECEHPAAPPHYGEYFVQQVLSILVSNPDVWAQTVVLVVYDENGGFFDHITPPTAPEGTPGEWLATLPSAAGGVDGPTGLGFRTPALVISPFSAGGYRYSGTLDHTSVLRFIETRFGVEVPNLSTWRRGVTHDFTGALNLTQAPTTAFPHLPPVSLGDTEVAEQAVLNALAGTLGVGIPYPLPQANSMPAQESTPARPAVPR